MDSNLFLFHRAETYHQFHSNFFESEGMTYGDAYTKSLYSIKAGSCEIAPVIGCPDGPHW